MTTEVRPPTKITSKVPAGTVTLVLGVLFAAAVLFTYALSLIDILNPPDWVRVVGLMWLPIGFAGIPVAYYLARTEDRARSRLGLLIGLVALVAFAALVIALG
jgi:hypothetical protein